MVLGDVDAAGFSATQLESLKAYVAERGGALVMLSGPEHSPGTWRGTPLEEVLPIELDGMISPTMDAVLEQPLRLRLTTLGQEAPQLQLTDDIEQMQQVWSQMPPLYWCLRAKAKQGVRVLAVLESAAASLGGNAGASASRAGEGGPDRTAARAAPVICTRFFGAGVVLFHATDESYRWSAHEAGKQIYARYWLQSLRYLSRSKLGDESGVRLTSDADRYTHGMSPELRVQFLQQQKAPADDQGVLVVLESEGRRRQLRLQRLGGRREFFVARANNLPEGDYRAWLASPSVEDDVPSCSFVVTPPQTEMSRLLVDEEALRQAAKASGGQAGLLADADDLLRQLPGGRQLRISPLPPQPLWNSHWAALAIVCLLAIEWLLRASTFSLGK